MLAKKRFLVDCVAFVITFIFFRNKKVSECCLDYLYNICVMIIYLKSIFVGNTHSEHLLQVVRGDTVYEKCDLTGHYVVSFRPDSGKLRCNNFWENFKLTCSTSCKGGINRRSAVLYFLLYVK